MCSNLVVAAVNQSLAAFHGNTCKAFFAYEITVGNLVAAVGQSLAIIGLFCAVCRQLDCYGLDGQLAVLSFHIELCRHIVVFGIQNLCRTGNLYCLAVRNIRSGCSCGQAGNGVGVAFNIKAQVLEAFHGQRATIVSLFAAFGFYRDLQFVLPYSVQIVLAIFGDVEFLAYRIFRFVAFLGGPACKPFVLRGIEAQVRSGRVFRVLPAVGKHRERLRGVAVVISQRQVFRRFAVHSLQRYITCHDDGFTGPKLLIAHFPILELQAIAVLRVLRVADGRRAALCILCGILPLYVVFNISDRTLGGIRFVIGRQGDIFIQLGVQVEDLAVNHPCFRLRMQRFQQIIPFVGIYQLAAVRHRDRLVGAILLGNGHGDIRGYPFCIQGNAFGGHLFAFKHILIARALCIFIPAIEFEVFINMLRPLGFVVCAVNRFLIFKCLCFFYITVVYKFDIVFLAVIVEFGILVILTCFGADVLYQSKTGNGISVFFGNLTPRCRRSVRMMLLIPYALYDCVIRFVGQSLDIVIGGCAAITRHGAIEFVAIQRHGVNVYLIGSTVRLCSPCRTAIFRRPFRRDILPIFGCDTNICILIARFMGEPSVFYYFIEPHLIHISLVIHIQNGRAIACDVFAFGPLLIQGKAILVQLSGLGRFACRAGFGFGLFKRIPVIVGILLPVDHGVLDVVLRLPVCLNGGFPGNSIRPVSHPDTNRQSHSLPFWA